MCSQSYKPARGDAGTNPSHQRWFLPVSATRLRRYRCAVSRDERHCAASASHSGETQGDASPPPVHTTPAPTRLFYDGSHIRITRIFVLDRTMEIVSQALIAGSIR